MPYHSFVHLFFFFFFFFFSFFFYQRCGWCHSAASPKSEENVVRSNMFTPFSSGIVSSTREKYLTNSQRKSMLVFVCYSRNKF